PIADRELRVAARRRSTRRFRWWAALLAMLMSFGSLLLLSLSPGRPAGNPLFNLLTGYTFALCASAGIFLTADSLSEEKRDGTLGLLFLTELKGYDVVIGKFLARSLNALYGLLALLPMTGIPLLIGGVTGGEFWRMALALANTLFFSLATGMFVSALAKNGRTAMSGTFGLLLVQIVAFPLLDGLFSGSRFAPLALPFECLSPFDPFCFALETPFAADPARFWRGLIASNLCGGVFLGVASLIVSRRWQDGAIAATRAGKRAIRPSRLARQKGQRERRLGRNPVYWLILRESGLRWLVWLIVILSGPFLLIWSSPYLSSPSANIMARCYYPAKVCGFILKMLVAIQAARFFAEARHSGALEVLLATPLRNREILKGQWLAIRSIFLWPLVIFLAFHFLPMAVAASHTWWASGSQSSEVWGGLMGLGMGTLMILWLGLGLAVDAVALVYVGSWLALSMKKPALAPAATILFVLVLPSIGYCGLDLLADLFFILWASTKLSQDLRWTLNQPYQQPVRIPPRTFPTTAPLPPIIPAR
ncbi:MAG TPA: ABC transporter permease subunit, partial [Methylomirabilota bacterium]|nr:ABC transporter permease subunit [Methylomirabilota bacterium]